MRSLTFNNIDIEYTFDGDEYIIHSMRCEGGGGLPDTVYTDMFYEAIDEDIAEDAGEHEYERRQDRYDTSL